MTAAGKRIQLISLDNLSFDRENSRLPASLDARDETSLLEWMLRDATLVELMGSIAEHGYFAGEPLLVLRPAKDSGPYTVVEGNRRLAAVKLLLDASLAPVRKAKVEAVSKEAKHKPERLPVFVYDHREEILDYLGYRHITGIKEWEPLAKAKYLSQLFERSAAPGAQEKFAELARTIGSRANYVARLLAGRALFEKIKSESFFGIEDLHEDSIDFSLLTTALSYVNIVGFLGIRTDRDPNLIGLKPARLKELTTWMFERDSRGKTRLGESRRLKELSAVVANEAALKAFRSGIPLLDAALHTDIPAETFTSSIVQARTSLEVARQHSHLVDKPSDADLQTLQEIEKIAADLRTIVERKRREPEGV